ncbi:MAG TPA: TIGR01777 family oxidoreductase [bacterium]|nr:TIGR01777 family oxidoreductase [bacterium]
MKILITGSHGMVGSALAERLKAQGHEILCLVRHKANASRGEAYWNAEGGSVDKTGVDVLAPEAVISLAGENIASGRWTQERKRRIRDSRVNGTRALSEALAHLQVKPKVFLCASAVGYFGSRGDEKLTEASPPGHGFLAEVCQEWEAATKTSAEAGIRTANLRFGVILSRSGGMLKKILLPFKLGVGGIIGSGRQYMSWITLEDVVGAIEFALQNSSLQGPVNTVAPEAVTNREFTKALGRKLWRPTCLPLPASTARMVFGEMADEMLLASARVVPEKLEKAGFRFKHPDLKGALKSLL